MLTSLRKCLSCAAERSQDRSWKVQTRSYPAIWDEDRSCQWIHSVGISSQKPQEANRGHRGASTMGYGPREAEEWTGHKLKNQRGRFGYVGEKVKGASFKGGASVRTCYETSGELLRVTAADKWSCEPDCLFLYVSERSKSHVGWWLDHNGGCSQGILSRSV